VARAVAREQPRAAVVAAAVAREQQAALAVVAVVVVEFSWRKPLRKRPSE